MGASVGGGVAMTLCNREGELLAVLFAGVRGGDEEGELEERREGDGRGGGKRGVEGRGR